MPSLTAYGLNDSAVRPGLRSVGSRARCARTAERVCAVLVARFAREICGGMPSLSAYGLNDLSPGQACAEFALGLAVRARQNEFVAYSVGPSPESPAGGGLAYRHTG